MARICHANHDGPTNHCRRNLRIFARNGFTTGIQQANMEHRRQHLERMTQLGSGSMPMSTLSLKNLRLILSRQG
jgi:hypothetical protein